ncbi:MAG: hypothetical protein HS116_25145 [Planctomycetes bacterium]|nr:hypothetical protein [Planctomycetota bacterium]
MGRKVPLECPCCLAPVDPPDPCGRCGYDCPRDSECQAICDEWEACEPDCVDAEAEYEACKSPFFDACITDCNSTYDTCTSGCGSFEDPGYWDCIAACDAAKSACYDVCSESGPTWCPDEYAHFNDCQENCWPKEALCIECTPPQSGADGYVDENNPEITLDAGATKNILATTAMSSVQVTSTLTTPGGACGWYRYVVNVGSADPVYGPWNFVDRDCESIEIPVNANVPAEIEECSQVEVSASLDSFACGCVGSVCNGASIDETRRYEFSDADVGAGWFKPSGLFASGGDWDFDIPFSWSYACYAGPRVLRNIRTTARRRAGTADKCYRVQFRWVAVSSSCGGDPRGRINCSEDSELEGAGPDGTFAEVELREGSPPDEDGPYVGYYMDSIGEMTTPPEDASAPEDCCHLTFSIEIKIECDNSISGLCPSC